MKLLGYICILSCWIKSAQLQPALFQTPKKILAAKGEQVELSCTLRGSSLDRVFWYKLDESSEAQFLISATILQKQTRGAGIDERFTLSRDSFRLSFSLKIKDLHLSDNGTYHCLILSSQTMILGDGSAVTVVLEKPKVTSPPPTTKRRKINRYKNPNLRAKKTVNRNGYVCNWTIWGSLAACNVLLLISTVSIVIHRRNKNYRRRCPHQFRKSNSVM